MHACDREWPDDALEEELQRMSAALCTRLLESNRFASRLRHFVGILRIDSESVQF